MGPSIKTSKVGFDSLPEQYVSRATREGFSFNILVAGPTGIGKTTLLDSLFDNKFPDTSTQNHDMEHVDLNVQTFDLTNNSINLKLTVVETKGFADQLDKSDCHQTIVQYIDSQFESYLQEELKVQRSKYMDSRDPRVHCCIYMIAPTGYGLRSVDLITMKNLHTRVCLIPVIAKADTLTKSERELFKAKIMNEIIQNKIDIYYFPMDELETVLSGTNKQNNSTTNINDILPFAVVASNEFATINNKKVRIRHYPWGEVEIENDVHSDFCKLRDMVLCTNMVKLVETTNNVHYEKYRQARLQEMGFAMNNENFNTFEQAFAARRSQLEDETESKKKELEHRCINLRKEYDSKTRQVEMELETRYNERKLKYASEKHDLEQRLKALQDKCIELQRKKSLLNSQFNGQ